MSKEVRSIALKEFRAEAENEDLILEGYAAVFDTPTVLYVDENGTQYKEVIDRGAFDETDFKKCCLKYNHKDDIPVLARVRGGSLDLGVDTIGLHFRGNLFKTQTSKDIHTIVKQGGIDECSFAFSIAPGGDYYDRETHTRHITKIAVLWDVSVVDHPAYSEGTTVSARSFLEAEAEKDKLESLRTAEKIEIAKTKLRILLELGVKD